MLVPTEEIVFEYVKSYVQEHGNQKHQLSVFEEHSNRVNINGQIEYKREVCRSLSQLSSELREFILNDHQQRFNDMLNTVRNSNPSYQDFKTLADELFSDSVSWYKIVTFLIFGAELVCRTIERPQKHSGDTLANNQEEQENEHHHDDDDDEEDETHDHQATDPREKLTIHTIKCLTRYLDDNLMQWICKQPDNWMSIKQYTPHPNQTKGMSYYFRMATLAAFVGGLYFCSKFILQK